MSRSMPTEDLITRFVAIAKKHHESTLQGNWREVNKHAKSIKELFGEIVAIGEEARRALLEQIDHDDPSVASMAAVYSLKYNTESSLAALRRIAREPGVVGFGAKQAIMRWEEGEWQLE
jgi:hypothetical protein